MESNKDIFVLPSTVFETTAVNHSSKRNKKNATVKNEIHVESYHETYY